MLKKNTEKDQQRQMDLMIYDIQRKLVTPFGCFDQFIEECTSLPTSDLLKQVNDRETIVNWTLIMLEICDFKHYDIQFKEMLSSFKKTIRRLLKNYKHQTPPTTMVYATIDPGRMKTLHDVVNGMFENRRHLSLLIDATDISDPFACMLYNVQDHVMKTIQDITSFDNCRDLYISYMKEISSIFLL